MEAKNVIPARVQKELDRIEETTGVPVMVGVDVGRYSTGISGSLPTLRMCVWGHWDAGNRSGNGVCKKFSAGKTVAENIEMALDYLRKKAGQAMNPQTGEPTNGN